uniref:Uncharacterized protein n=1 Tax=Rhizophora mucronata TaxID=61149 RepID=A0A2P2P5H1_RHIMU
MALTETSAWNEFLMVRYFNGAHSKSSSNHH